MRTHPVVSLGLVLFALLGLAAVLWTRPAPASGQAEQPAAQAPALPAPSAITASGDFVYVLRGNTITQLKSADLSVVKTTDLAAPAGPAQPAQPANP